MTPPLVCTLRDQQKLQREFELLLADTSDPLQRAADLGERFRDAIRLRWVDWTVASPRLSEHVWTFGGAQVRYRIVPDAEAVEILSVGASGRSASARAH